MTEREKAIARLERDIERGGLDQIEYFLVDFLSEWGPEGVDVQRLAKRVLERQNDDE